MKFIDRLGNWIADYFWLLLLVMFAALVWLGQAPAAYSQHVEHGPDGKPIWNLPTGTLDPETGQFVPRIDPGYGRPGYDRAIRQPGHFETLPGEWVPVPLDPTWEDDNRER